MLSEKEVLWCSVLCGELKLYTESTINYVNSACFGSEVTSCDELRMVKNLESADKQTNKQTNTKKNAEKNLKEFHIKNATFKEQTSTRILQKTAKPPTEFLKMNVESFLLVS